jgi:hypothetical protein
LTTGFRYRTLSRMDFGKELDKLERWTVDSEVIDMRSSTRTSGLWIGE